MISLIYMMRTKGFLTLETKLDYKFKIIMTYVQSIVVVFLRILCLEEILYLFLVFYLLSIFVYHSTLV